MAVTEIPKVADAAMQHSFRALSGRVKGLTLLKQDSARGSATCAAGDSPSAAPPTVATNSADSSEELEKLRKDVERLRDEVERLRGENKQLNERMRFYPRQAVSEWLSMFMHLQLSGGVAEEAVAAGEERKDVAFAPEVVDALARLEDSDWSVRCAAVLTLGQLDAVTLAQHAPAILARLEDSETDVREAAVSTLGKLNAATLAQHAPALVARLEHSDSDVRKAAVSTLGKLDAATLAPHAPALLARLEDTDWDVRCAAVSTLGQLDAATLAPHAPALVARLEHSDSDLRA